MADHKLPKQIARMTMILLISILLITASGCDDRAPSTSQLQADKPKAAFSHLEQPLPNFLLIVIDTWRYDVLKLGKKSPNMPFLASLREKMISFDNTYSTSDSTPLSHFSILTGYIRGQYSNLDSPQNSIPYQLSQIGYDTFGIVANWILHPKKMPVLSSFGWFVSPHDRWVAMDAHDRTAVSANIDSRIQLYEGTVNQVNRARLYSSADRVISLLQERLKVIQLPFFGFLNFLELHDPFFPDPAYYDKDREEAGLRPDGFAGDLRTRKIGTELKNPESIRDEKRRAYIQEKINKLRGRKWSITTDLSTDELLVYKKRYEAQFMEMDQHLKSLFDLLKEENLLESTIIIITSDHGESFGEDDFITHWFYEEGDRESTHRVPLFIYFPEKYGLSDKNLTHLTSIADIPPTIYDIVGINWYPLANASVVGNFGKSLMSYITSTSQVSYKKEAKPAQKNSMGAKEMEKAKQLANKTLRTLGYIE